MTSMTNKEMCVAIARHRNPSATDEQIAEAAEAFWNASPSGDLGHVFGAYRDMRVDQLMAGEVADDPVPAMPHGGDLRLRRVPGGVEELCFDGRAWQRHAFFEQPAPAPSEKT